MQSAGKQIRSLQDRELPMLKAALGAPFQNALGEVVKLIREMVLWFTAAVSEGGKLYPVLVNIGAALTVAARALRNFLGFGQEKKPATTLPDTAAGQQSSIGNAIGAAVAQTPVTLGKNPKIVMSWEQLGLDAALAWMQGFTSADFSILNALQSPLRQALSVLEQMGQITNEKAGSIFRDISSQLMSSLSGGGTPGQDFYKQLTISVGKFGEEIGKLVQSQLGLARATDAVEDAEKRLKDARKAQEITSAQVNDEVRKYNKMLREGASKAMLDAQMKRINNSIDARDAARKEVVAAEEGLDVAKEQLEVFKKLADAQSALVQQLIELARMQLQVKEDAVEEEDLLPTVGDAPTDLSNALGKMHQDVDAAALRIEDRIRQMWNNFLNLPAVKWVRDEWAGLIDYVRQWWEEHSPSLKIIWDEIAQFIQDRWTTLMEWDFGEFGLSTTLAQTYETMKSQAQRNFDWWGEFLDSWAMLIEGDYEGAFNNILEATQEWGLKTWELLGVNEDDWQRWANNIAEVLNDFNIQYARFLNWLSTGEDKIRQWIDRVYNWFYDLKQWLSYEIADHIRATFDNLLASISNVINWLYDNFWRVWDWAAGWVNWVKDRLNVLRDTVQLVKDRFQSLVDWFYNKFIDAMDTVQTWINNITNALNDLMGKISGVIYLLLTMIGLGGSLGGATGGSAGGAAGGLYGGAAAEPLTKVTSGGSSINVNFGGVNINNGMDMEVFKAQVLQTVNQAVRG